MLNRILDANLNRLREGIRVIEDIARYILEDKTLASNLKAIRHKARIESTNLLESRNIKNDILKTSIKSELARNSLQNIIIANFKRTQESARVLEEILKLDSTPLAEKFKNIRYELYDIEIAYMKAFSKHNA